MTRRGNVSPQDPYPAGRGSNRHEPDHDSVRQQFVRQRGLQQAPWPRAGGSAAAASGGDYTIGVSVADQKSLFYVAAVQGMKKAAADAGVKRSASANNNSSQQVDQVNDLLNQEVGALVFISQDSTAAAAGVKAANKADMPVIAVDQRPESGNGDLATYIATDSVKAAEALCTWVFQQMGGSGEIAILQGVLGSTAEIQRTQGCQEALDKNPNIKVVAEDTANWDETEGYKAAQNILPANPNLKAVFGESDAMGLGAAKAAQDTGKDIIFVGIDGFPTMFDGIKSGLTQATMAQQPYHMGELAVTDALQILGGGAAARRAVPGHRADQQGDRQRRQPGFYGPNAKRRAGCADPDRPSRPDHLTSPWRSPYPPQHTIRSTSRARRDRPRDQPIVKKSFSGVTVLKGVDFTVPAGKVVGLIGENGAGKSTLSSIIAGVDDPPGSMTVDGQAYRRPTPAALANGVALIHQEIRLLPELSVAENIFLGRLPAAAAVDYRTNPRRPRRWTAGHDLDPRRPVGPVDGRPAGDRDREGDHPPAALRHLRRTVGVADRHETEQMFERIRDARPGRRRRLHLPPPGRGPRRLPTASCACVTAIWSRTGRPATCRSSNWSMRWWAATSPTSTPPETQPRRSSCGSRSRPQERLLGHQLRGVRRRGVRHRRAGRRRADRGGALHRRHRPRRHRGDRWTAGSR